MMKRYSTYPVVVTLGRLRGIVVPIAVLCVSLLVIAGCTDVPVDDDSANVVIEEEKDDRAEEERDTIERIPANIRPVPDRAVLYLSIDRLTGPKLHDKVYLDLHEHLVKEMDTLSNGSIKAISLTFGKTIIPVDNVSSRSMLKSILVRIPRIDIGTGGRRLTGPPYSSTGGVELRFLANDQLVELATGDEVVVAGKNKKSIVEADVVGIDRRRRRVDVRMGGLFWNYPEGSGITRVSLDSLKLSFGY